MEHQFAHYFFDLSIAVISGVLLLVVQRRAATQDAKETRIHELEKFAERLRGHFGLDF